MKMTLRGGRWKKISLLLLFFRFYVSLCWNTSILICWSWLISAISFLWKESGKNIKRFCRRLIDLFSTDARGGKTCRYKLIFLIASTTSPAIKLNQLHENVRSQTPRWRKGANWCFDASWVFKWHIFYLWSVNSKQCCFCVNLCWNSSKVIC